MTQAAITARTIIICDSTLDLSPVSEFLSGFLCITAGVTVSEIFRSSLMPVTSSLFILTADMIESAILSEWFSFLVESKDLSELSFEREGDKLVCPKCEKELKVLGADYRKIGAWHKCSNGHLFNMPNLSHKCLECNEEFNTDDTSLETLYEYTLTEKGLRKLRLGLLKK